MRLGKVVGTLVSTCKVPSHENFKIMVVQPLDPKGKPKGDTFLALDTAQAGVGDTVIVCTEGRGCAILMGKYDSKPAVNTAIAGVVDYIHVGGEKREF